MRRVTNIITSLALALLLAAGPVAAQVIAVVIQDGTSPDTALTSSQISGNPPLTVIFTALCRDDIEIASCIISFGDGSNQILQNIQLPQIVMHTYMNPGNFVTTLTATDTSGNSDQTPSLITIGVVSTNIEPQTALSAVPLSGESPLEATFIAQCGDTDGTISSCEIDFGDGSRQALLNIESPQTARHTYENPREVNLFRVASLNARDDKGGTDQTPAAVLITVLPGFQKTPETAVQAFPAKGKTPMEAAFNVLCFDADGTISLCEIDFGDGEKERLLNIETPQQASHVYINNQVNDITKIARVRAIDNEGNTDPTPAEVTITVRTDIGNAPVTYLQAIPINGTAPLQVVFNAQCSDLQKRITDCAIGFGDGSSMRLAPVEVFQAVSHIYRAAGIYIATLNSRDAEGLIDLTPASVMITVGGLQASPVNVTPPAPAEKSRVLEFGIDVANFMEQDEFAASNRLFNGLLFGSNELRINIRKSFVKEITLEIRKTNNLGELVASIDGRELYRGKPEAFSDSANLQSVNFAANGTQARKITIPVNEDMEGVLKIRTTSSGFVFWAPSVYEIRASVAADVEKVSASGFDFVLDRELEGFREARISQLPAGTIADLNGNRLTSQTIPKDYFRNFNRISFAAGRDTSATGKIQINITYIERQDRYIDP